jgi:putative endonuclease
MFCVYLIRSIKFDTFYIGYTSDINDRITRHNEGRERYTKKYLPWEVVYIKEFKTKGEALKYEKYLKSLKSKIALQKLMNEWRGGSSTG